MIYDWIKALHIVAVISWMAGMLYLPRLYVYHADVDPRSDVAEKFEQMERRLLRYIINPAMVAAWVFGLTLAWLGDWWMAGWFHAKLALLIAMQIYHAALARWRRAFAAKANRHSSKFYRIVNEIPTILMIGIVILVTVKPF